MLIIWKICRQPACLSAHGCILIFPLFTKRCYSISFAYWLLLHVNSVAGDHYFGNFRKARYGKKQNKNVCSHVNIYSTKLAFWKTHVTILRKDSNNWMTQLELLCFTLCGRGLEILNWSSTLMQLKLCQRDRSILNSIKTLVKLILCQRTRSILWQSQFLTKGVLYSILADGSL